MVQHTGVNLAEDLRTSARAYPDKPAIISKDGPIAYRDLDSRADRLAAGLHKIGIRKGDRVAFSIGNTPDFACLHFAALRAGAISVPMNPMLRAAELRPYLASVAPRVIVSQETFANEVMSAGPHPAPVYVIGRHPSAMAFSELEIAGQGFEAEATSDDLAVLAYTSGTAGAPKGAMLSHGNLAANLEQMVKIQGSYTQPDDIVLAVLPLSHIFGLNVVLGLSIRQGATIALEERFDAAATLRMVADHGVTILAGAPPMYLAWLAVDNPPAFDLSKVRFAVSGASRLPPEVIPAFREAYGVEIWEGYGLTETAPTVATTRMGEQRPGSIGLPLPDQEVRIVDASGEDVMMGDPGEIWVKGPNVFKGYWEEPEATSRAFSGDWFKTGDIAYQDEDGYLWLVDRQKEVIIVSGFNVFPGEVEEAIRIHPSVADAAVLGVPDPRQGERVKAFVVTHPEESLSEEEVIVHSTKHLARFKVPSEIQFVDELPRMPSGKVVKRMIRSEELGPAV